jgi:hypothetical protein
LILPILKPILISIYDDPERLVELILLDLPTLLGVHVRVYWEAKRAIVLYGAVDTGDGGSERATSGDQYGERTSTRATAAGGIQSSLRQSESGSSRQTDFPLGTRKQRPVHTHNLAAAYHSRLPLPSVPYSASPISPSSEQRPPPAADIAESHIYTTGSNLSPHPPVDKAAHTGEGDGCADIACHGGYELSPVYLTALSDSILRRYLPSEQYASDVQRLMAMEILGRTVIGGLGRKLGEGWFWWGLILRFVGEPKDGRGSEQNVLAEGYDTSEAVLDQEQKKAAHAQSAGAKENEMLVQEQRQGPGRRHNHNRRGWHNLETVKRDLSRYANRYIAVINTIWTAVLFLWKWFIVYWTAPQVVTNLEFGESGSKAEPGTNIGIGIGTGTGQRIFAHHDNSGKYVRCLEPTIHLLRQLLQVDDHSLTSWMGRMVFGGVEMVLLVCSPMIDRCVQNIQPDADVRGSAKIRPYIGSHIHHRLILHPLATASRLDLTWPSSFFPRHPPTP